MFDMVVKNELPGASQELRLKELNKKVCSLYGELGTDSSNQVRRILLSTVCQPKNKFDMFPELTGVKARQVRYLVPVMLERCQDLLDGSSYRQHRHDCVKALCDLYEAMDSAGLHPDEKASAIFKRSTENAFCTTPRFAKWHCLTSFSSGTQCTSTTWHAICLSNSSI